MQEFIQFMRMPMALREATQDFIAAIDHVLNRDKANRNGDEADNNNNRRAHHNPMKLPHPQDDPLTIPESTPPIYDSGGI